jgi:membrane protein DedA with SNARE-associated domain
VEQLVLTWVSQYGAVALFGLLMLGIFGLPVPDETLLTFSGVLISRGKLPFLTTWLAAVLGGMSGISCSYILGRTTGLFVVHHYGKWLHLTERQLEEASAWLSSRGKWSLTFGYFIPGFRHITGIVAGASRLHYGIFATFAYLGAGVWATLFVLLGWYVGENWQNIVDVLHRSAIVMTGLLVLAVATYFFIRRRA